MPCLHFVLCEGCQAADGDPAGYRRCEECGGAVDVLQRIFH